MGAGNTAREYVEVGSSVDLRPLKTAQQLLDSNVDERGVLEELRLRYRISFVDAVAAIAAARTLTRHGIEVRA